MRIMFCFKNGLETCVFWKPKLYENTWKPNACRRKKDQSDNHRLICECDHLTAFAIMDISRDLVRLKGKNSRFLTASSCTSFICPGLHSTKLSTKQLLLRLN